MNLDDLKIEVINPVRPGGQTVGIRPQEVKVTHIPTGITASSTYERSQHRNKTVAIAMIEYGLAEIGWKEKPASSGGGGEPRNDKFQPFIVPD